MGTLDVARCFSHCLLLVDVMDGSVISYDSCAERGEWLVHFREQGMTPLIQSYIYILLQITNPGTCRRHSQPSDVRDLFRTIYATIEKHSIFSALTSRSLPSCLVPQDKTNQDALLSRTTFETVMESVREFLISSMLRKLGLSFAGLALRAKYFIVVALFLVSLNYLIQLVRCCLFVFL